MVDPLSFLAVNLRGKSEGSLEGNIEDVLLERLLRTSSIRCFSLKGSSWNLNSHRPHTQSIQAIGLLLFVLSIQLDGIQLAVPLTSQYRRVNKWRSLTGLIIALLVPMLTCVHLCSLVLTLGAQLPPEGKKLMF